MISTIIWDGLSFTLCRILLKKSLLRDLQRRYWNNDTVRGSISNGCGVEKADHRITKVLLIMDRKPLVVSKNDYEYSKLPAVSLSQVYCQLIVFHLIGFNNINFRN
jgi:hypothetical protein